MLECFIAIIHNKQLNNLLIITTFPSLGTYTVQILHSLKLLYTFADWINASTHINMRMAGKNIFFSVKTGPFLRI